MDRLYDERMNSGNRSGIKRFLFSAWLVSVGLSFMLLPACAEHSDNLRDSHIEQDVPSGMAGAARAAGLQVGVAFDLLEDASTDQMPVVSLEFTSVTPENSMKWRSLAPAPGEYDFSGADQLVDFASANGQRLRGHTLFWHRLNGLPSWIHAELDAASDPAARLQELMVDHTAKVIGRYAGRIAQWDVINEPLGIVGGAFDPENIFYQLLGEEYLDLALLHAHAADPSAELFINETFTEFQPEKFDALLDLAQRLLDRGAPLHGIGLQGHFFLRAPDEAVLRDQLQRIAALGLKAEITELDIPLPLFDATPDPLSAQAQAYADVFTACLAVPLCSGITVWGVDDANTWLDSFAITAGNAPNRPLLFDEELQAKPAYYDVVDALLQGAL
jgi:endo-1,4-beta-xylanase